jgi:pathogenesis-related protein 1
MKNTRNLFCQLFFIASLIACKGSAQTGNVIESGTTTSTAVSAPTEFSTTSQMMNTGSKVTPEEAQEFLAHHNMARNEVGVSNLVWNAEVAAVAQNFADRLAANNCSFQHSGNSNYGENLFMGNGIVFKAVDGSKSWYEEKADFVYARINDSNYSHYTQMVWKTTTDVGVGVGICADGSYIIVANYAPGGNMLGEFPY